MAKRGFLLLELSIYLVIMAVLVGVVGVSFRTSIFRLKTVFATHETAHLLQYARFLSLAEDVTTRVVVQDQSVQVVTGSTLRKSYSVDSGIALSQSQDMGFTGTGSTSKAGTITLADSSGQRQVSLGVGYGQIAVK